MSLPKVGFNPRKVPTRVKDGGTGASTVPEVREKLGVPSLDGGNTFGGINYFNGEVVMRGALSVEGVTQTTETGTGALDVSGIAAFSRGVMFKYVAKTADYTLTTDDVVVDVTANSPTITLPTAVVASTGGTLSAGTFYVIKNSGAGTVTLATTSGQTIDGAAPGTIAAGNSLTLVSTGANWISV